MGEKKKAELEALYIAICEVLYDYDSFIDAATELTTFFEDGHTNIELPYILLMTSCFVSDLL